MRVPTALALFRRSGCIDVEPLTWQYCFRELCYDIQGDACRELAHKVSCGPLKYPHVSLFPSNKKLDADICFCIACPLNVYSNFGFVQVQ